jgi:hypothetical protein
MNPSWVKPSWWGIPVSHSLTHSLTHTLTPMGNNHTVLHQTNCLVSKQRLWLYGIYFKLPTYLPPELRETLVSRATRKWLAWGHTVLSALWSLVLASGLCRYSGANPSHSQTRAIQPKPQQAFSTDWFCFLPHVSLVVAVWLVVCLFVHLFSFWQWEAHTQALVRARQALYHWDCTWVFANLSSTLQTFFILFTL